MVKSFSQFLKDKNNEILEDKDGVLDEPIHFKHTKKAKLNKDGVLDEPIHFKHTKKIKESALFGDWVFKKENTHLDKKDNAGNISKQLHKGQNFTPAHRSAITQYTTDSTRLNKSLIKNEGKPTTDKHKKLAGDLDDAIDKNRIKHPLVVHSGVSFDPRKKVGSNGVLKSHAFMSTTHNKFTAEEFANKSPRKARHVIRVALKPGDPATHIDQHSFNPGEHETIIKRNTRLKLEKTETDKDDYGSVTHIHHMSIV